jgi:membrane-associated phospholipid phosphatase
MVIGPTVVAGTDRMEPSSTPQALDSRVGLFEPEPGGVAERTASRLGTRSPFAGGAIVGALAYVVLAALFTAIGLLLTQVVFGDGPVRGDIAVNEWFADRRTSTANTLTEIGSHLSETATVIAVAAIVVAILGMKRYWRSITFLATGLILEVTVFLTTTLLVDRDRPEVEKLDSAPPTSSFPSGHVAAAIVLYVGIALIVATHVRSRAVRVVAWFVAAIAPCAVLVSRLYRGMHFPTDVGAGVLLGFLALFASLLVVRVAVALAERGGTSGNASLGEGR